MLPQQVLAFSDATSDWDYRVPSTPDSTFGTADNDGDSLLQNFFSRPIKIHEFVWPVGADFFEDINPWGLYFSNPRVINRIANFSLLRAKLHIKVIINGNAFYYGRGIVSYQPMPSLDTSTVNRSFFLEDIVQCSQRPHIYIDPTTSQGGQMEFPFVFPDNAVSIPLSQWSELGALNLRAINFLRHANGSTVGLTVTVFAWATDVHMAIPTTLNPLTMVPQSGDEYQMAPISQPAAVVARVAAQLSNIPIIGKYALATEMVSSTVASIARSFGYARPVVVEPICPLVPTFGNYANTNMPDTTRKFTLDAKQEVTVDSSVIGLDGTDEMAIRSISTRETYLTTFAWNVDTPPDNLLFNARVTPALYATISGTPNEYHLSSMCFVTLPFRYWRGSIKYRFQVVASGFHKGRLRVAYDPSNFATVGEYNVNYSRIVDISTEKDFTITVGWGNKRPFLQHRSPGDTQLPFSQAILPADSGFDNGILAVYVANSLTEPNETVGSDVQVNVYVSTSDDFEVVEPEQCNIGTYSWKRPAQTLTLMEPQSGESDITEQLDSIPYMPDDGMLMASKVHGTSDIYKVMFADPVTSIRQVVKRYVLHSYLPVPLSAPNTYGYTTHVRPDFPPTRGAYPGDGFNNGGNSTYAKMTHLNWFAPAFVARRGGIRWKYIYGATQSSRVLSNLFNAQREPCETQATVSTVSAATATSDALAYLAMTFPGLWPGGTVNPYQNPVLEIDLPYYTNKRFFVSKELSGVFNTQTRYHSVTACAAATASTPVVAYVAGSDDFSLSWYTGPPILYQIGQVF